MKKAGTCCLIRLLAVVYAAVRAAGSAVLMAVFRASTMSGNGVPNFLPDPDQKW
jgi:hypothetical protein